eukprot:2971414-Ditylum_brightwellii.AAC.1
MERGYMVKVLWVKRMFGPIDMEEAVPIKIMENWILIIINTANGGEEIIVHHMKLQRDTLCVEIEDEANVGCMFFGIAKELALASTWLKFGDLLPILKGGIEDVSRATPGMQAAKMRIEVAFDTIPTFNGGSAAFAWGVIEDISNIVKDK